MQQSSVSKLIKFIVYIIFAFFLNQISQAFLPGLTYYADVFYILPWAFAYLYGGYDYLFLTIPAAIFRDWLFSSLLGMSLIVGLFTSFLAKHFLQNIWQRRFIFLPIQVLLLSLIAQMIENFILDLNLALQFDLPLRGRELLPDFNIQYFIITVIFTFIIGYFIYKILPFINQEKDVYAEDNLRNREKF